MKKNRLAASAAFALVAIAALPGTAFAAVDPLGTDPELDQACSDLQRPNDASEYKSLAVDVHIVGQTSVTEVIEPPLSVVGVGPATTGYSNFSGAFVNGQSPNIWASAFKTVIYPGGAVATYQTKITTTIVRAGACHVHKPNSGNDNDELHPGYQVAPSGLQTSEPVTATSVEVTYGTTTVNIPGPWTDPNASGVERQLLICISPGKKPGEWRAQHGYDGSLGQCSRALYDSAGGSTPSASLPST